ncbi:MgtC/SapB family protein [Alkalilimnicola ehrlichii MLHE-1]|nr:MgtC/SapB family protein [Alkalilimnicola ehrlichii]
MEELTEQFIAGNETILQLAVALLLGALIGLERGWESRELAAGRRVAGIRTYALLGLLGGLSAVLSEALSPWAFPVMLIGVAALTLVAYRTQAEQERNVSITGAVGQILTFSFGAIAVAVDMVVATAGAVVTVLILDNKREIHGLINQLHAHELDAAFKLLLISVVMLPLLPDEGMGPGRAINPYEIWWLVVLIASVSFVGYFAVRVGGTEKGILFTSLFAGLSSSTALTLHFSRQSRQAAELSPLLAAGILIACGTMFPRILLYALIINPALIPALVLPVIVMATLLYLPALVIWHRQRRRQDVAQPTLKQNPLDLKSALMFGALLTAIMFLGEWLREWLGDAGIYLLAASSGVADVDAITLSLTRMSNVSITLDTAVMGIVIAASVNNLIKGGLAAVIGTGALGKRVTGPMLLSLAAGLAVAWWQ